MLYVIESIETIKATGIWQKLQAWSDKLNAIRELAPTADRKLNQ